MYWNRSGKITAEPVFGELVGFDYFIDGKKVHTALSANNLTLETLYSKVSMHHKPMMLDGNWYVPAKEFYKRFGATPSAVVKWINGHIFHAMVLPHKHLSFLFKEKNIQSESLFQVIENIDIVNQMMSDDQKNLIPIIQALSWVDVSKAREIIGKANWKKLCKNTAHRNKLISKQLMFSAGSGRVRNVIDELIDLDSGALDLKCAPTPDLSTWLKKECNITYKEMRKRSGEVRMLKTLWTDTQRMAQRQGREFNPKWSMRRMQEEHDALSAAMNAAMVKYQRTIPQEILDKNLSKDFLITEWELNGVRASLLTTYDRICKEGKEMHHCVASYAEQSMGGRYFVVHIDGDDEATTVGYHIIDEKRVVLSQHHGKHNSVVRSQNHEDLADIVEKSLESQLKEKHAAK